MKDSFWRLPLRITWPSRTASRSPGPATTRLMKFTSARSCVGWSHAWLGGGGPPPHSLASSAPAGGWKTTTSPTEGSLKRAPMRLTSTRWPTWSVGTIDSDGIRYGLTRKAWMPSASPRATTTIRTSSRREPPAELLGFAATGRPRRQAALAAVFGGFGVRCRGVRRRVGGGVRLLDRLRVDGVAGHFGVLRRRGLGRGIVQQAGLDDLLRTHVAALAHAGALADAAAQVVELGAADVTAGGDLDALDLRRVHGERALHADAEGLLADREGLTHALALALDDDALEDLRTATRALDDLEVDLHAITGGEAGDAAQLCALEAVDDGAHGEKRAACQEGQRGSGLDGSEEATPAGDSAPAASAGCSHDGPRAGCRAPSSHATPRGACSAGTPARLPAPG